MTDLGIEGLRVVEVIGQGGFGTVMLARDEIHGRDLAVKVLPSGLDESARRQFERERRAMGAVSGHPAIATVHTSGFTPDGRPFIAMELLEGGSLADHLSSGPMPVDAVVSVGARLADALTAAHEAGVLHLDVKPENVLFDRYGSAKLVDFGIAALADDELATASIRATPAFAAPEVLDGHPPTATADVYGLGVTLYALLMGRSPYAGDSVLTVLRRIAIDPVPEVQRPDAPPALCVLLRRAMDKSPDARPSSMREFADELRSIETALAGGSSAVGRTVVPGSNATVVVEPTGGTAVGPPPTPPAPSTSASGTDLPSPPSTSLADPGPSNVPPPSPGTSKQPVLIGAAAAIVVIAVVATVLWLRADDMSAPTEITPAAAAAEPTAPPTTAPPTTAPPTTAPPTTAPPTTAPPTTAPPTTAPPTTAPPTTALAPVSTAVAFDIVWSSDIDEEGRPVDELFFVVPGTQRLCGTWFYDGIAAGTSWVLTWTVDGAERPDWSATGINPAGADRFFACTSIGPVESGLHEVVWEVEGEVVLHNSLYVGDDRSPAFVEFENATGLPICTLNFNASSVDVWGLDWLGLDGALDEGEVLTIGVPTGEYDYQALDCDGNTITSDLSRQIDGDATIRLDAP